MRVLILIALLCNMAFSAPVLNGAEYTQIVTINHLQVAETNSDFLFQLKIPRVGALLTAVESADDVAFTNVNDTTRRARWVVYTPDTIFLYSHIAVSSTADTSYRLQYGKSLNETNAAATFTNCGITNFWGLNESSGSSSADYTGLNELTLMNAPFANGFFINSISKTVTNSYAYFNGKPLSLATKATLGLLINFNNTSSTQIICNNQDGPTIRFQIYLSSGVIFINTGASLASVNIGAPLTASVWHYLEILYDGTGSTLNDRLKVFLDGTYYSDIAGTAVSQIPEITSVGLFNIGGRGDSTSAVLGYMDEIVLTVGNTLSSNFVLTKYNMLFNPSTFSTLGTPLVTEFSAEMGIDTLTFTCSAENAFTYQWFLDGNPLPGETDSVLVIYADSMFYSTAHTLYCLVNSSVISDSWVITTEFSAEMGIDTLRLVCSAENAITWQWYDNNVAVTGATDSVYTIYADSTFYSIKHVIYCLVNGSVKSGEWKFQTPGIINRKITIGPNLKIY